MANMAEIKSNGQNSEINSPRNFDEIISDLDLAYRDGNPDLVEKFEAEYERALDALDCEFRTEQMHNENWFYTE